MPHIRINWVDIILLTLLVRISYVSFKNGLLPEFFRLLGLLSAYVISLNNYTLLTDFLSAHFRWISRDSYIIFSFLFIFLVIAFSFILIARLARLLLRTGDEVSGVSRLIGLVLGSLRGLFIISLVYILLVNSPFTYLSQSAKDRSFIGQYISEIPALTYKIGINCYPFKKVETPLVRKLLN